MLRRGLSFTFILELTLSAFLFFWKPFASGKELSREVTCFNDILHLDCGKRSIIAIHDAYFTTEQQRNQTCRSPTISPEHDDYIEDEETATLPTNYSICFQDIRLSINRKCSGYKSCNYTYNLLSERICASSEGYFVVTYDCAKDSNINKYCNSKTNIPEGYIASPGFPQFYPQLTQCSWTFTSALDGQSVLLKILHLRLRPSTEIAPTLSDHEVHLGVYGAQMTSEVVNRCDDDRLTVMEGIVRKESVCGEDLDSLRTVEVDAGAGVELRFRSTAFMPAAGAGFLVYFKVEGCPTLAAGEGSYLLERNGSFSVYACRHKHRVFNDTLQNSRALQCIRNHHWNDSLPPCVALDDPTTIRTPNTSMSEGIFENTTLGIHEKMNLFDRSAGLVEDIILPCVIIGSLLIVNVVIVIVIFAFRRRQKPDPEEIEELSEHQPQHLATEENFDDESLTIEESSEQAKAGPSGKPQELSEPQPSTSTAKEDQTQV